MLEGLGDNARAALIAIGGAVAAFVVFGGASRLGLGGPTAPSDPSAAMPKDSFLVATVDLDELRRSPIHNAVLGKDGLAGSRGLTGRALPIRDLTDACGFDPLTRVSKLAIAVPEEGDNGELGLAARVTVTGDELTKCTKALARDRGGAVATHEVGSFIVAETGETSVTSPRLAYGRGGLLVVGRGHWFDAMLDAAMHTKPGLAEAPEHTKLRASLTSHPGFSSPTVLVSAILPRSLRDRLKKEMTSETDSKDESKIMAGVLDVSGLGVALEAGPSGGNVDAAIELVCDTAEGCASVEKLILKKRLEWSKELTLRLIGLGQLLDSIKVERTGVHVRVTAEMGADALAATVERVLRLRSRGGEPPSLPGLSGPARRPDETLSARDGGAGH